MLPWKLQKRQFLPVNQNLSSVHFSLAKFQLVSSNLSLAMIWQMTYNHKLSKLCSATLTQHLIITQFALSPGKEAPKFSLYPIHLMWTPVNTSLFLRPHQCPY